MAPEGDLRRSADLAELRFGIVSHHRVGLLDERVDRLLGAAAHEVGQGLDVVRFLRIQLGREAPREDPLNHHLRHVVQRLGRHLPALHDGLDIGIALGPGTVQRKRLDPVGILGGQRFVGLRARERPLALGAICELLVIRGDCLEIVLVPLAGVHLAAFVDRRLGAGNELFDVMIVSGFARPDNRHRRIIQDCVTRQEQEHVRVTAHNRESIGRTGDLTG